MADIVFKANDRTEFGSAASRRLRRGGRVPAVIYGQGGSVSVDLDAHEFSTGIKGVTESTIVRVDVNGKTHETFVKATQRDIRDGRILHVDFYEIETGKPLRARVPLRIFGSPVGVRDGGVLETAIHAVEVECLPKDLPPRVEVDIGELKVNQTLHVRDLALGEGVKLISGADQVVALVKFAKVEAAAAAAPEETPAGTPAGTPAAAPAAPGAGAKDAKADK
ncbi:MAG: 50S ribosomal protein L25 [Spirochaetaceae bacterium]|jgi:large subunit ribosomal protein L25|nr:50S ribosomal protein L25 [Spirochaetaceae bacterium]